MCKLEDIRRLIYDFILIYRKKYRYNSVWYVLSPYTFSSLAFEHSLLLLVQRCYSADGRVSFLEKSIFSTVGSMNQNYQHTQIITEVDVKLNKWHIIIEKLYRKWTETEQIFFKIMTRQWDWTANLKRSRRELSHYASRQLAGSRLKCRYKL